MVRGIRYGAGSVVCFGFVSEVLSVGLLFWNGNVKKSTVTTTMNKELASPTGSFNIVSTVTWCAKMYQQAGKTSTQRIGLILSIMLNSCSQSIR